MRPIETILILGNVLAYLALAVPRLREALWLPYAGLLLALLLAAQLVFEGYRWQMVPAYGLAALFVLVVFVRHGLPVQGWAMGAHTGLLALILIVSIALPAAVPMFELPAPTGPHAIGTLTYHWVDDSRTDIGDPAAPRELMVQIWYPAEPGTMAEPDTYLPEALNFSGRMGDIQLPGFFLDHLTELQTHAMRAAPMAGAAERFPVLVFSPGARGYRQHNTFQVEDLASHGYVVASIDHPHAAREVVFPDGRRIAADPELMDVPRFFSEPEFGERIFNYLGEDVSFALDRITALDADDPNGILTGRLDTDRMGMFGVSLGGLVAAEACRIDPRFRACLIEDVFVPGDVIAEGVSQPTLWLSRDADSMRAEGWSEEMVDVHQSTMQAAFEGAKADGYIVHIPGMFHLNYTDFPFTMATPLARALKMIGPIDWQRGHTIINAYTLAFFDRYLKEGAQPLLEGSSERFPEVELFSRSPSPD